MKTLNLPKNILHLDAVCALDRTAAVSLWLALKSTGSVLEVGCRDGNRCMSWKIMLLRFKRRVIGVDWSGEHRIDRKQRKATTKFDIGRRCKIGVEIIDTDPALMAVDNFQPLGFTLIDYDYSIEALRRVSIPILAAAPVLASPNVVVAWAGYEVGLQHPEREYKNEVPGYVASLDTGDTYHFRGSDVAFKVFNATTDFREELRALAML